MTSRSGWCSLGEQTVQLRDAGATIGACSQSGADGLYGHQPLRADRLQQGISPYAEAGADRRPLVPARVGRAPGQQAGSVRLVETILAEEIRQPVARRQLMGWCHEEAALEPTIANQCTAVPTHTTVLELQPLPVAEQGTPGR